jgi:pimeloyl-ACP methyl ester carboxylesterase
MLKVMILPWLTALLVAGPASATSVSFEPCSDAATHPNLVGSLCVVTSVPLDPSAGSAAIEGEVSLFVRKFPVDPHQRQGEVWLIAGGPGEAGASFYPVLNVLRQAFPEHDLVIPDHRGTGYSSKLCPIEEALSSPSGIALADDEWAPCIGAMHAEAGRTRAFTVTNAAHDLASLIARHRGEGEVYLYGASYGTQLVLRTMQVAPIALDGIILDGLVPPEADPRWDLSRRTKLVDAVGQSLLTADQTALFRVLMARENPAWRTTLPGGDLRGFMGRLLNFPDLRARIPAILTDLSRDDTGSLATTAGDLGKRLSDLAHYPQSPPSIPLAMLIGGSENNHRRDLTADIVEGEARDALFTSPIPGFLVRTPVPLYRRDRHFGQSPVRLPRTLVVHGTMDPNTSHEGAVDHAAILSAAGGDIRFTTVTGAAHFLPLVAPECFERAMSKFVSRKSTPEFCAP